MIIVVYVDDLNLIGTPQGITEAKDCLKKEFEIKDLFFCIKRLAQRKF